MERPALAPWLPPRKPKRCRSLRWFLGCVGSIFLLVYILLVGILLLLSSIPSVLLKLLIMPAVNHFGYIVEYVYSLGICRLHVTLGRLSQQFCSGRPYHSRCLDLRSEFLLDKGGYVYVHPIPCMAANYAYLIVDGSSVTSCRETKSGLRCCVVDPCDATAVVEVMEHLGHDTYGDFGGLVLEAVLCTHKHWDHAGGNRDLRKWASTAAVLEDTTAVSVESAMPGLWLRYAQDLRVYGGYDDDIPGRTHPLEHEDVFRVGVLEFQALATPGHTVGSMVFGIKNVQQEASDSAEGVLKVLFTGDCLFSGGCGAPFEGSELDIEHCFASILLHCDPRSTSLFPGHEYTEMLIEDKLSKPDQSTMESPPGYFLSLCGDYYTVTHRRSLHDSIPTIPCTIVGERQVNPVFKAVQRRAQTLLAALDRIPFESADDAVSDRSTSSKVATSRELNALPFHLQASHEGSSKTGKNTRKQQSEPPLAENEASKLMPAGFTVDGRHPDFVFMYRNELESVRGQLVKGALNAEDVAARLTQLERNVFESAVLTGDGDAFDNSGVSDAGGSDDEMAPDAEVHRRDSLSTAKSFAELKSRAHGLSKALRVLSVPAAVPLGRKAPCTDDKLPVCVSRLLIVLQRLGIRSDDSRLGQLSRVLHEADSSVNHQPDGGDGQAMASDKAALIPLKMALQMMCPVPVESHWARCLRVAASAFGCCCSMCSCCCGRRRAQRHDAVNQPSPTSPSELESPPESSVSEAEAAQLASQRLRRRFVQQERGFTKHRLDRCPVCCGSFAARCDAKDAVTL